MNPFFPHEVNVRKMEQTVKKAKSHVTDLKKTLLLVKLPFGCVN